jgi:hypothetical protein
MRTMTDWTGRQHGCLTVLSLKQEAPVAKYRLWTCRCRCGQVVLRSQERLSKCRLGDPRCGRLCSLAGVRPQKLAVEPTRYETRGVDLPGIRCYRVGSFGR